MSVSCECCVLLDRILCVGLITRPEESTECGVSECDREASIMRRTRPTRGCCAKGGESNDPEIDVRDSYEFLRLDFS
jgi:hypothetical protein